MSCIKRLYFLLSNYLKDNVSLSFHSGSIVISRNENIEAESGWSLI